MTFRVLFVCTGNVCRSPAAEVIFAQAAAGHDIACASAGITGLTGRGVDEPTALALRDLGYDPSRHEARRITPGLIRAADLVLAASGEHRSSVVREEPTAFRRVFTMREFARLGAAYVAADVPATPTPAQLVERVGAIADQRGRVDAPGAGADDIADPFGAGPDVAREAVLEIRETVAGIVAALGLAGSAAGTDVDSTAGLLSAESGAVR